ncbi:MAG TPA: hypothetical protein G4O03_01145 [Dehalococcoidia bacterium]|nr:hypothetical protein [Dehalococcoidia bacterium]
MPEIDWPWLLAQAKGVFEANRVEEVRKWNRATERCLYHAPFLDPPIHYPRQLPKWLHRWWRLWWQLRLPWQVIYPHQWLWDSCAHAITLSLIDPELAQHEILSLLYAQQPDGFIPHVITNPRQMHWVDRYLFCWLRPSPHISPYLQPPNIARAVEVIHNRSGDVSFLHGVLPRLRDFYLYLDRVRHRDGRGLVEIIISYESGKDRSREYDAAYGASAAKPILCGPMLRLMVWHRFLDWDMGRICGRNLFRVKDLLFNCVYAWNLAALSRLFDVVGSSGDARLFQEMAQRTEGAILSQMYDPASGLFYSLDARYGQDKPLKVATVSTFLPLLLDRIERGVVERLVEEHLTDPGSFWPAYPVPAEPTPLPPQERGRRHLIWRGRQTWVYSNWFIVEGLRKQAGRFPDYGPRLRRIADEITLKTYQLVRKEGFCEYFDSDSGEGSSAKNFGWSTLVLDMVYSSPIYKPTLIEGSQIS